MGYSTKSANFASNVHYKKRIVVFNQALVTSVASQCFLHCGNQRMCPQVQPTLILLAVVEKGTAEGTNHLLKYATSTLS